MIEEISIPLERAEGPHPQPPPVVHQGPDVWGQARGTLSRWSHTAPAGGGYDKVDFVVTYPDGETYAGRYDLVRDDRCDLAGHMREFLQWCTEQDRDEELRADARTFLAGYAIGTQVPA